MKRSLLMLSVLAALPSGYAYRSDTPMIMPDMSYLDELQRYNRYEDSLDIIDGSGSLFVDCSQVIKRFEQNDASCGSDYTGTITKIRKVYGSGTMLVRSSGRSGSNIRYENGRATGVTNSDIEVACSKTPDGYTSQWQETSNTCLYTPLCNASYEEEVAGTCPEGYSGTLTKSVTYRSKYFGQKVTQSQCNSGFNKFNENTYSNCKEDVPPTINDEKIVKDTFCNSNVSVNGEMGKWVKFGRGGNAFWLPMYTDYIEKYGVADFYEKIYNAKDRKILESEFNGCYFLDDTYKNADYDDLFTIKIEANTLNVSNAHDFKLYKSAEYNLEAKNIRSINTENPNLIMSGDFIKMENIYRFLNHYYSTTLRYKNDITLTNISDTGVINNSSNIKNISAKNLFINNNSVIGLGVADRDATLILNIENEIIAPKIKTGETINRITAKKAVFYSLNDKKSYMTGSNKLDWRIQDLIVETEAVIRGNVNFNGNITSNTSRIFNYNKINGNTCFNSDNGYLDNFGIHNGKNVCKDNNGLVYIPNEICNSQVSINGENGKWVSFKQGGNAFWLPMYTDYIEKYGVADFYEKIYNAKDRKILESEFNGCYFLDDTYKNTNYDGLFTIKIEGDSSRLLPFNLHKSAEYNLEAKNIRSIDTENPNLIMSGDFIKMENIYRLLNVYYSTTLRYKNDITLTNISDTGIINNTTNMKYISAKNLFINNNSVIRLGVADRDATLVLNIENEIIAPQIKAGETISRITAKKAVFYSLEDKKSYMTGSNKLDWRIQDLIVENEAVIRGNVNFNGNITSNTSRIFNYNTINGNTCFKSDNGYLDNFGIHNGKNICKDNNGLVYIPNEICNNQVSVNDKTGKWVSFKQGGNAFWLPMYTDYIEKYGVTDFYEKVYNAKDRNILESEFNGCYFLDDTYKNADYDNLFTIKIEANTSKVHDFKLYKSAEYNLEAKNIRSINTENPNLTMSGDFIKMENIYRLFNVYYSTTLRYKNDITLTNISDTGVINNTSNIKYISAKNLFINNNSVIRLGVADRDATIVLNIENEIIAPQIKAGETIRGISAKKAVFHSLEDKKSYMNNPIDSNKRIWNVQGLETTSTNDVVIRGDVIFNGDIRSPGRVFIYSVLNGDIYITDQASIVDEFNKHNGQVHNYNDPGYGTDK